MEGKKEFGSKEYHQSILNHTVKVMGIWGENIRKIWYECECGMEWK